MEDNEYNASVEGGGQASSAPAPTSAGEEKAPVSMARQAQVATWISRVTADKKKWAYAYKRMRNDMTFARGKQWPNQEENDDRYVANLTQRHIAQRVAALYAKNPTAVAKRRDTLDFAIWDGDMQSVMQAQEVLSVPEMAGTQQAMQAMQLLQDVQQGQQRRKQLDAIAKTLETVYAYEVGQQLPVFKKAMKRVVRRTVTTGVGYVKLGYHRLYEYDPADVEKITDVSEQLAHLQRLTTELADDKIDETSAQMEELKQMLTSLQNNAEMVTREGLDFDYPDATSIIPDSRCKSLHGFVGARWLTQEFLLSPDDVKEVYKVDLGQQFTAYDAKGANHAEGQEDSQKKGQACVWEIYDKSSGLVFVVCDGHSDFLIEPAAPKIKLEQFWPIFTLIFNDVEDEKDIYPPSDVALMRDMQVEHNLSRQRLREHRDANRPKHVTSKGSFSEEDKGKITQSSAHTVVELDGLAPGENISAKLQPLPHNPIDPNLYETNSSYEDILKTLGSQEANMGGSSGATATETSIAESSRLSSIGSNVDDLDDFLTDIAANASHILLEEMDEATIMEIAGPGAAWPVWSASQVARDLWLEIKAGSSGRPNRSAEIQNFERMAPYLMQIPGMQPKWLAEQAIERLDDRLDLKDAFLEGMPSITAMNSQTQAGTGDPASDPNAQGGQGGNNAEAPQGADTNLGEGLAQQNAPAPPPNMRPDGPV